MTRALRPRQLSLATLAIVAACTRTTPAPVVLEHEAYLWQRAWTGAVSASAATAAPAVGGLRVLIAEVDRDGAGAWPDVDPVALARGDRPVTAVVRLDGARPPVGFALAPVLARIAGWQQAGVEVVGVEIDHDCATAALPAYARWLHAARPPAPLRWSITALPTWAESPALAEVAGAVDELVVQVHAVRAPRLFERALARGWLEAFAAAVPGAHLRVALPTYQARVAGELLAADPVEVAVLVRDLERRPIAGLDGVVWFRLPTGDGASWASPTLDAVITGAPLAALIEARLIERGPDVHDVVLVNTGTLDGAWPSIRIRGALTAADLVAGYQPATAGSWIAPRRVVTAGAETVVGWATGKDLRLDVH